jgi:cytosine/adenosine deaminase-related metal-dependent hydrolase
LADTLIQNAGLVLTMDKIRRAVPSGDVLMRDGRIVAVGRDLPATGCTVVNAEGCLVTPGLVNTHHHLYQTMTRAVPAGQDAALFDWLQVLYPNLGGYAPG